MCIVRRLEWTRLDGLRWQCGIPGVCDIDLYGVLEYLRVGSWYK